MLRWITPSNGPIEFSRPKLYISNDGRKLVLVDFDVIFLIQALPHEKVLGEEKTVLNCSWTHLNGRLKNFNEKSTVLNISCSFFFCKVN